MDVTFQNNCTLARLHLPTTQAPLLHSPLTLIHPHNPTAPILAQLTLLTRIRLPHMPVYFLAILIGYGIIEPLLIDIVMLLLSFDEEHMMQQGIILFLSQLYLG